MADRDPENPPKPAWVIHHQLQEPKFSDVQFNFDNKVVHAHSMIIQVRSKALHQLIEKNTSKKKNKSRRGVVTVPALPVPHPDYKITSDTFETVLQFLYADNLDFDAIPARAALDLSIAGNLFELPRLVRLAQDRVRASIDLGNVHHLLKVSHDTKEETCRKYCVNFASKNRKEFISNKDAINQIGVELFQDVMAFLMLEEDDGSGNLPEVPESTLRGDFKKLYSDVDMGATPGDACVVFKGVTVPFHKAFLASHSKSLTASFQPTQGGDEVVSDMLKVKTLLTSVEGLRAVLKYAYFGEMASLNVHIACEVQEFAKTHGMHELQQICEYVIATNITTDSIMSVMRVVFNAGNIKRPDLADIRRDCLSFFRVHIAELSLSMPVLIANGPLVMAEIILAWQISEQAKQQGVSEEEMYKEKGLGQVRRASEIQIQVDEEEDEPVASSSNVAQVSDKSAHQVSEDELSEKPSAKEEKGKGKKEEKKEKEKEKDKEEKKEEKEDKGKGKKDDKKDKEASSKKSGLFSRKKTEKNVKDAEKEDKKKEKGDDKKKEKGDDKKKEKGDDKKKEKGEDKKKGDDEEKKEEKKKKK